MQYRIPNNNRPSLQHIFSPCAITITSTVFTQNYQSMLKFLLIHMAFDNLGSGKTTAPLYVTNVFSNSVPLGI